MTEKKTPWSDDLAVGNALQRIALAAEIVSATPAEIADFVCAALESPFGRHGFSGLVLHMMRAADDLAAGAEALGAAINRNQEALEVFSESAADNAELELYESESHLTECHERVVRQAQRYGRRANRVRDAISEHHSSAAAQALIALGDRLADADLSADGGAQ